MALSEKQLLIRQQAEQDLVSFIHLIAPQRVLGAVHEDLCRWWQRDNAKDNQLVLLPRDHQKSALVAYRVAWWITKYPETTVLYVSATANLAEKQLKFIQDILLSPIYRRYWPEMVNAEENKREKWTQSEICIDHPKRKEEGIRDATIAAVGITANTTGLHCNVAVLDDIVVPGNAYTELGREQVRALYSQLASIETTGAKEWVVGTRYHPDDIYKYLNDMVEVFYNEETDEEIETPVYEVYEKTVETNGEFLWPKQRRYDGRTFGFDERELARKKAKYLDITQFYAQYYNNPNAVENRIIDDSKFQYYEKEKLEYISGSWYLNDKLLTIYAAVDFAYTIGEKSDYTAIVVVAVDEDAYIYVLDVIRFRTNKISIVFDNIEKAYRKWGFRKLRAEVTAGQAMIVQQIKDEMRREGLIFTVDENRPTKKKEERINANLEPRYQNQTIWHYKGGNCQILEEELLMNHPEHDDCKDALAAVMEIISLPTKHRSKKENSNIVYSSKFGGVAFNE